MNILIVEDDLKIAGFVMKGLKQEGYNVEHVSNGEDGFDVAMSHRFDVAIFDVMLPKLDGISLVKKLRQNQRDFPILILSAKNAIDDRVTGLQVGADDYLVKPFAFSELLARIQALIRRRQKGAEVSQLKVKDLEMDCIRRKVFRNESEVELQPKEFVLLEYLMRNKGRVISKTMIMENVWGYNFDPQTNVVEARVCHLRDKINKDAEEKLIRTIRGVGYVIE
jgi:two-component system OmpR family response regulator